jgi:hypothetical protein
VISTDIVSGEIAYKMRFPVLVDWKQKIRRKFVKFAGLLLLLSTVVSATAFRGSHSTGRSHSRSSSHVRSYKGSHRSTRATSSAISRNRHGRIRRSSAAKHSFERQNPCPSTGRTSGRCPGYVVDHVKPLECGGADAPSNMQWQTVAAGRARTRPKAGAGSFLCGYSEMEHPESSFNLDVQDLGDRRRSSR